ncbi:pyridine nucleotide-disulfide oxidoreductase [Streptomyces sp. NPDC046557]|uniref:NAD(P)/FAD-dependent oxidoreductase n=1 Tax=Streptomyces sp. NPDC046557 TaxID=3155372 RepID=UPI0033C4DD76
MTPSPVTATTAVVLGGSLAGMLAAAALVDHMDHVVIVERDILPAEPAPRRGLPQGRHGHMLWSGGAQAIEALLPGITNRWAAAGAHTIPVPQNMVGLSPRGWYRRWTKWPPSHFVIGCSRDRLDFDVRQALTAVPRHQGKLLILDGAEPLALTGSAQRVTGVKIRTAGGTHQTIDADLVIDTTGRATRTPQWLAALGVAEIETSEVDSGLTYASRDYQVPPGAERNFPIINVQADPAAGGPGQAGTIFPMEGGRWRVSLSGTRDGRPTNDNATFEDFARGLRHPLIADFLADAVPVTDVHITHSTSNFRHHFEKAKLPAGFLALGDALAAFNPVYGHGMTAAALGALTLGNTLAKTGSPVDRRATQRAQRAISRVADAAWLLATGSDIWYPGSRSKAPHLVDRMTNAYIRRLILTACGSLTVTTALTDVMSMEKTAARLAHPTVLWAALLGPQMRALEGPILTDRERGLLPEREGSPSQPPSRTTPRM